MLFRLTSYASQLSVENAMANSATATMADIVASDSVTAEQGIFVFLFFFCVIFLVVSLNSSVSIVHDCALRFFLDFFPSSFRPLSVGIRFFFYSFASLFFTRTDFNSLSRISDLFWFSFLFLRFSFSAMCYVILLMILCVFIVSFHISFFKFLYLLFLFDSIDDSSIINVNESFKFTQWFHLIWKQNQ